MPFQRSNRRLVRLAILWFAGTVMVFLLAMGCFEWVALRMLQNTDVLFVNAGGIDTVRQLENTILTISRDERFFLAEQDSAVQEDIERLLLRADALAVAIDSFATSPTERAQVDLVVAQYGSWRALFSRRNRVNQTIYRVRTTELLAALNQYRILDGQLMQVSLLESQRLARRLTVTIAVLSLLIVIMAGAGGTVFWRRIIRPVVRLAATAHALGEGKMDHRVPVEQDDEVGALCRVFNTMADDIRDRETARRDFLAGVAHDLKNPLTAIGGATELLADQLETSGGRAASMFDMIRRNVTRLEHMAHDLMDSIQIESGRMVLDLEQFDLVETLQLTVSVQRTIAADQVITLDAMPSCPLRADRRRLERVFDNLLSNAIKYSRRQDVRIAVRLQAEQDWVEIVVSDNGVGIAPEDQQRLFQPFGRLDRTRRMAQGTGLGLFAVKQIVELHGGRIWIESEVARGTDVHVRLPRLIAGPSVLPQ